MSDLYAFPLPGWKPVEPLLADVRALEVRAFCVNVQCQEFADYDVQFVSHGCASDGRAWAMCQGHLDDAYGESLICHPCLRQGRRHYLDVAKVVER